MIAITCQSRLPLFLLSWLPLFFQFSCHLFFHVGCHYFYQSCLGSKIRKNWDASCLLSKWAAIISSSWLSFILPILFVVCEKWEKILLPLFLFLVGCHYSFQVGCHYSYISYLRLPKVTKMLDIACSLWKWVAITSFKLVAIASVCIIFWIQKSQRCGILPFSSESWLHYLYSFGCCYFSEVGCLILNCLLLFISALDFVYYLEYHFLFLKWVAIIFPKIDTVIYFKLFVIYCMYVIFRL